MKIIEPSGEYGAHWGLTNFYDEDEKNLREVFESGDDFQFSYGCKKEIRYAIIEREAGITTVSCRACIDELMDMVDTLLWEVTDKQYSGGWEAATALIKKATGKDEVTDAEIYKFMDEVSDWVIYTYEEDFTSMEKLENCTYYQLIEAISINEDEAEKMAHECYKVMIEIVKENLA